MNQNALTNSHAAARSNGGLNRTESLRSHVTSPTKKDPTSVANLKEKTQPKKRKPRQVWTPVEDAALLRIVERHPFDDQHKNHWAQIATKLNNNRSGKQCRDRWQNHLRPDIKKGQWTKEEEQLIRDMHQSFGTKWSCMAKLMKDRTDNDIKNKWYSMMRKEKKAVTNGATQQTKAPGIQAEASFDMEQFEDADCDYDNITYQDLAQMAPEANHAHLKALSSYIPQAPYNWHLNNTYVGQNVATYMNPHPVVGDRGAFVLLPGSTMGQSLPSVSHGTSLIGPHLGSNVNTSGPPILWHPHAYKTSHNEPPRRPDLVSTAAMKGPVPFVASSGGGDIGAGPTTTGSDSEETTINMDVDVDSSLEKSAVKGSIKTNSPSQAHNDPPGRGCTPSMVYSASLPNGSNIYKA